MKIIKPGKPQNRQNEYYFVCGICGCEWTANEGDKGLSICFLPSFASMDCPNCRKWCVDRDTINRELYNAYVGDTDKENEEN